jgi:Alkaline phosphatase PhoX
MFLNRHPKAHAPGKWAILASTCILSLGSLAFAADPTSVPNANPKIKGSWQADVLSPELVETPVAQGSISVENPSDLIGFYGYNTDGPQLPVPGDLPSASHKIEASKTEPDKNTYLVLHNQKGPDPNYNYGSHFLFQGHETGQIGYFTRVNLDADGPHRVTLMADHDVNNVPLPTYDGSTWYPFSERLLLTAEAGANGGVWQATLDFPSKVEDISGIFGRGGYEGIQADRWGNLIIAEDVGGKAGTANPNAKQPNSFIYRFLPADTSDLKKGGRLQALQVIGRSGNPIVFHANNVDGDILSPDVRDLHTYHLVFRTKWVTIHDTSKDGFTPFGANALAKAAGATPFKRPENGQFRPGSDFAEYFFDETGDTDNRTQAGRDFGGFGSIQKLTTFHNSDDGALQLFYLCDVAHTAFDNTAFWTKDKVVFVEDRGDTLHTQANALDSAFLFDVRVDYANAAQPVRILAQGRDPSATLDSAFLGMTGFQNEGDNEITGWHLSNGDPGVNGLLGARDPKPFEDGWRLFYTGQHGDNVTYEIRLSHLGERDHDDFNDGRGHDFD